MVFCALLAAVMVALALAPVAAIPLGLALAALFGPPPGAIMAMPGRVLRPDTRAAGLGLFLTVYYVLMALGPAAAGVLGDRFGLAAPVLFGAALFLAILPLVAVFALVSRPTGTVAPDPAT
jgi:predicted MFS family arabinose efflux permease